MEEEVGGGRRGGGCFLFKKRPEYGRGLARSVARFVTFALLYTCGYRSKNDQRGNGGGGCISITSCAHRSRFLAATGGH